MQHFSAPKINPKTYDWSVRAFSTVRHLLGVNIKLHASNNQIEQGHIFLFNHFSRFETFIPQYLIYQEQKVYCRSIAAAEFFHGDERFTRYLHGVGAVPNDMPNLLAFLARDILRGHKVIIFPEGGMVKDKKILSDDGQYTIYSPSAAQRRKHHSGAARLALVLDLYKHLVLEAHKNGDKNTLKQWVRELDLENEEALIERCQEPTRIIPSNITFYPIRISENFLKDSVERFTGRLADKYGEELLIESNLLFKDTDMDIRMGPAIETTLLWPWWDQLILKRAVKGVSNLNDLFSFGTQNEGFLDRLAFSRLRNKTEEVRDLAMKHMYGLVTLNLSHMASALILRLIESGMTSITQKDFLYLLYLSARYISHEENIYLHQSLLDAETYRHLRLGQSKELNQFLETAEDVGLITTTKETLTFLDKLKQEHDFHAVRMENPICVYANECAPILGVKQAIERALADKERLLPQRWVQFYYEDDLLAFEQQKEKYSAAQYCEINSQQTQKADARPFLLEPATQPDKQLAVLLIHGFLASPAEMKGLGTDLANSGYHVYGLRLDGHGTSPCDLRLRSWEDWMRSVQLGYDLLSQQHQQIVVVGFSTGGALALRFAAERPEKLAGLCAVSTPLKFANPNLRYVPLIHHANKLTRWLASQEGILPYLRNDTEHPDINYQHIPIRALYELRKLVGDMDKNLSRINCPTRLIQGDAEQVVKPESARLIRERMVATTPEVVMVTSTRHGIIADDISGTRQHIIDFINRLEESA